MSPAKGWPQGQLGHSLWAVVRITDLWTGLIRMVHTFPGDPNASCSGSHLEKTSSRDCADRQRYTLAGRSTASAVSVLSPSGGHKPPNQVVSG